ncbi:unnamed protein product [Peniophora sp. CBMAI 1063]|nr:unnamed protein product [Peniophora sp. CBMAI 1063]
MSGPKEIVIVGAGIIGSTTAFYLARHSALNGARITILEASKSGAAQGASGKAGGLVAKWAYPSALTGVSFKEHVALAEEFDGAKRWGWRWTGVGSVDCRGAPGSDQRVGEGPGQKVTLAKRDGLRDGLKAGKAARAKGMPDDLTWVNADLTDGYEEMAPKGHTAQVHPYLFTTSILSLAVERGVQFVRGRVNTIDRANGRITGVHYVDVETGAEHALTADTVILTAGAWSPTLLPELPIVGQRAHSIVLRPPPDTPRDAVAPYVLFANIQLPGSRSAVSPEIYPRGDPDPEIYVCGPGDTRAPLPPTVDEVEVDKRACEEIYQWVAQTGVIEPWAIDKVFAQQACYLPNVQGPGGPIIGKAPGAENLFIATGHTCWGICNAPGTAKAVAELVLEGAIKCANLAALDPKNYM